MMVGGEDGVLGENSCINRDLGVTRAEGRKSEERDRFRLAAWEGDHTVLKKRKEKGSMKKEKQGKGERK